MKRKSIYRTCPDCGQYPKGWKNDSTVLKISVAYRVGCLNWRCNSQPETAARATLKEARAEWNSGHYAKSGFKIRTVIS